MCRCVKTGAYKGDRGRHNNGAGRGRYTQRRFYKCSLSRTHVIIGKDKIICIGRLFTVIHNFISLPGYVPRTEIALHKIVCGDRNCG